MCDCPSHVFYLVWSIKRMPWEQVDVTVRLPSPHCGPNQSAWKRDTNEPSISSWDQCLSGLCGTSWAGTMPLKMCRFSTIPNSNLWLQDDDGTLQRQIHLDCSNATMRQNCSMSFLLPGSAQTVDTFGSTAMFYLDRIGTKLTSNTQRLDSDYKLLRTFKLLTLKETDINIL